MALDTQDKRMAAMNPGCPWRGLWPIPDGDAFSTADRVQILFLARADFDAGGGGGFAGDAFQFKPVLWRRRR